MIDCLQNEPAWTRDLSRRPFKPEIAGLNPAVGIRGCMEKSGKCLECRFWKGNIPREAIGNYEVRTVEG